MNRRDFSRFSLAAVGGIFMGRRWYQQGRGLIVPESGIMRLTLTDNAAWRYIKVSPQLLVQLQYQQNRLYNGLARSMGVWYDR